MKRSALLAGLLLAVSAHAGDLAVAHAWVRWLPGDLPAAGYATIENRGAQPQRLTGVDSPDYAAVMLHRSVSTEGVDRMQAVGGLDLPAHTATALAPGGYHLMLMRPRRALAPGDRVMLRLHFADGSTLEATAVVRPPTAQGDAD